ncbi:MAG: phenylalanine--tRNA ligase subunit beta [Elusimicrobia bacterium]|nr:phenylalanine--tRNA ligase subunit beta [Elusimicrobiota bacterium]
MKISYAWLKEHLPLALRAEELARHLEQLGIEVSGLERRGPGFSGVVSAEILSIEKHPNADRLCLCALHDGTEKLSVVCGAKNIAVGQKVPLARIGAVLPGGREIVRAKIRGVESQGMICSSAELGLGEDKNGILVLDPETLPGQDMARLLGPADDVFDLELTPNRPDCLSHLGMARELAAYFKTPLKKRALEISLERLSPEASPVAAIPFSIEDERACPRYRGQVFAGLQIGPSPGWLAVRLESVGLRPVNNLVDITNYMLLDMGQPLHAFDLDKLEGGQIRVRCAKPGETILALDGKEYALSAQCLVVADARKPVAVAGVMGGLESAVTAKTTRCLLECAHFAAPVVRKTGQALRLRSDSSYRFERGTDVAAVGPAALRAAELILKLCGPAAQASRAMDVGRKAPETKPILFSASRINSILGAEFPPDSVRGVLGALADKLDQKNGELRFWPPSHRSDLETVWDLAEETGRMLGYDNIPSAAAAVALKPSRVTPAAALAERCRRRLAGFGLMEAYNYDFLAEKTLEKGRLNLENRARLANPISEDWTILRPSLLLGLLQNAQANRRRGASAVRLFEIGKVYAKRAEAVEERAHLAGLLQGPVAPISWKAARSPDADFYDAKGLLEEMLAGLPGLQWSPMKEGPAGASDPLFHAAASLRLKTPRGVLGAVGLLNPQAARAWELERQATAVFELDLEVLAELPRPDGKFKPYSLLPSAARDLCVVMDQAVPYSQAEEVIGACAIPELASVALVDVFSGKRLPADRRSLTFRLSFSSPERTLTDDEVNSAVDKILKALKARLGAELRS